MKVFHHPPFSKENVCDFIEKEKILQRHGFESSKHAAIV
jgi:hypothetical protein